MKPEQVVQSLLMGSRKEKKEALAIILHFSKPNCDWAIADKCQVLRNCSSASSSVLLEIINALIFSPELPLRECCIEILRNTLSRPERKIVLGKLLEGKSEDILLAIHLIKEWGVRVYGEMIENLLDLEHLDILTKTVDALMHISLSAWEGALFKRYEQFPDEVRVLCAQKIALQKSHRVKKEFLELMLNDALGGVRVLALQAIHHQLDAKWIGSLCTFLKQHDGLEERTEAIKCLGLTQHADAILPLLDFALQTDNQNEKWSIVQALERIDQRSRLKVYQRMIEQNQPEQSSFLFELIGSCEGEEAFLILKAALARCDDLATRSLIASAIGATGHPEGEPILLNMLNGDVVEAYAAASALKNLMRDKVMDQFGAYLSRNDVDVMVKQILLQHVAETAKYTPISDELRLQIEAFLKHENENLRYLAIQAISAMAFPQSLEAIIAIYHEDWTSLFKNEIFGAIENCCQTRIRPLLDLMVKVDEQIRQDLYVLAKEHPLSLTNEDLTLLCEHEIFKNWNWDIDLLPCIEKTHRHDPDFIWRQFSRPNLSDRCCCFLARGFDASQPSSHELIEPKILIQCFNRFQTEKPLLLLGKLMSNFPCVEFLPPLIQYSQNAGPETEMIFKSYVRKIILSLPKY